jgi:Flp pilus assembly protein TadD
MQLAAGQAGEAVKTFRRAVAKDPLPEHLWWLAESLRAAHLPDEARRIERELVARGPADDPRTVALFLATRGKESAPALALAERELRNRADVFTHDAVAWTRFANDRAADAWPAMERALAEGTQDARLFLHAGVIAAKLGRADASEWLERAREFNHLLMPSERALLDATAKPALAAAR